MSYTITFSDGVVRVTRLGGFPADVDQVRVSG